MPSAVIAPQLPSLPGDTSGKACRSPDGFMAPFSTLSQRQVASCKLSSPQEIMRPESK